VLYLHEKFIYLSLILLIQTILIMKKILIILLLTCFSYATYAQVQWLSDYELAKSVAKEKDQLILMDFWAIWCGPCKTMERELWTSPELSDLTNKVVPLKVNVDNERQLASYYRATTIPKIILITATGETIWEQTGYSSSLANRYIETLNQIPNDLNGISEHLTETDDFDDDVYYTIGKKFQTIGYETGDNLNDVFLSQSDNYFKKVRRKSENDQLIAMAELGELINDAYRGKYKKVVKKMDDIDDMGNEQIAEQKNFLKAYYCKHLGDKDGYAEAKEKIKDNQLLSRLEE
jgi:thiol-disulfide isomerase/thioredoxin